MDLYPQLPCPSMVINRIETLFRVNNALANLFDEITPETYQLKSLDERLPKETSALLQTQVWRMLLKHQDEVTLLSVFDIGSYFPLSFPYVASIFK